MRIRVLKNWRNMKKTVLLQYKWKDNLNDEEEAR